MRILLSAVLLFFVVTLVNSAPPKFAIDPRPLPEGNPYIRVARESKEAHPEPKADLEGSESAYVVWPYYAYHYPYVIWGK